MRDSEPISVIIPVYNEEAYLEVLLRSLERQTFPANRTELLFVDGESTDGTLELLKELRKSYVEKLQLEDMGFDPFRVLSNPRRSTPCALNIGVYASSHDIIVRLDAHCEYADDYFEKVVEALRSSGADIVGGPTRVAGRTVYQHSVGRAICSRFAVGGSRVHQIEYRGDTDSVTFGAWRRRVFEKAGAFDERLVRNQDDEFHYRAREMGFRIYQEPEIELYYYPRDTPGGLFRQYFGYGKYKPLVLRKVKSGIRLRHLVPSGFVLYLCSLPLAVLFPLWLVPLGLYFLALAGFSLGCGRNWDERRCLFGVYPVIHCAYGFGFLSGGALALSLNEAGENEGTEQGGDAVLD